MQWFPEDSNLAPAVLHTAALPDELENQGREAGTRTPSAWPQTRSADPYATSRVSSPSRGQWTAPDSNREPSPCGGVALPIGASSPGGAPRKGRAPDGRLSRAHIDPSRASACYVLGVHAVELSYGKHVHPHGWCWQGRHESNAHSAGSGDRPPIRWVIPSRTRTAVHKNRCT